MRKTNVSSIKCDQASITDAEIFECKTKSIIGQTVVALSVLNKKKSSPVAAIRRAKQTMCSEYH